MLTTVTGEGIGAPNISTGSSGHDNSIAYTTNDPSIFFLECDWAWTLKLTYLEN
jgi:hypothetical protein